MKKILFVVCFLIPAIAVNAQSFARLTVRVDTRILEKEGHVQISLTEAHPVTTEYFINVLPDKTVEQIGVIGAPEVSYTTSTNYYSYPCVEIIIDNFVTSNYYILNCINWYGRGTYDTYMYCNGVFVDPGVLAYPMSTDTLIELKLYDY